MKAKSTPKSVNIKVGGDVRGQIVVGDHNLLIGGIYGGVVNFITPEKQPTITPRPKPVYLRPRAFPGLLDRETEQKSAIKTLQISESLSISGEDGIGKTALMRYLAYNSPGDNFPDGIIYLSANGYHVEDLKQYIFESFFETDISVKPTEAQLSRSLQKLRALILLDDLALSYAEVNQLFNSVPQSNFILGSSSRCLWGEGTCLELGGLPIKESLALLEREIGRGLNEQEKLSAEEFCREVNGNPLTVLQAAGLYHHGVSFAEMLGRLRQSKEQFVKDILSDLSASQRQVLFLLAASQGQAIPVKHLAALSQDKDLDNTLKKLIELKLIQSHSPAYSLTGTLALSIGKIADAGNWEERLLNYFVGWIKQNPPLPDITDALDLTLKLLEKSNREHRWDDVIALGKGIENALCMVKRWEAWLHVLEWILNAAQALGNRSLQGWALHQLGTRELCLGNLDAARQTLTNALNIRNALGDKAGAAITQHNLNLIIAPPAPPRDTPRSGPKPAPKGGGSTTLKIFFTLTGVAVTAAIVIIAIIFGLDWVSPPKTEVPIPPAATTKAPVVPKTESKTEPPPTEKPPPEPPTEKVSEPPTEPPMTCNPGIWYCENFEDKIAQYWELSPAWSIQQSRNGYVLAGSRHEWASLTEHQWDNFRVRFDLRLQSGTIHLNYRIMPDSTGLVRYYVGITEKYIYLQKSQYGGGWKELLWLENYFPLNEWHTVEIAGWGNHLAVFIDEELVMQYVDNEAYLPNGSIAFETLDDSTAQIDNIEAMEAGEEPIISFNNDMGEVTGINACLLQGKVTDVTTEYDLDRIGFDFYDFTATNLEACQQACIDDIRCKAYTFNTSNSHCWLKEQVPEPTDGYGLISGVKECVFKVD